jgi:hypothetical protein
MNKVGSPYEPFGHDLLYKSDDETFPSNSEIKNVNDEFYNVFSDNPAGVRIFIIQ